MASVLVTGASGGFGGLIVRSLLSKQHTVFAAMRGIGERNQLAAREARDAGAVPVEMDVTSEESVRAAVAHCLREAGVLDVVVNNAGVGVIGVQETFTAEDWKRIFDVNVFGVQRVVRAVAPHMRLRRSGLILQISSLLGRIAIPFYGPYNASKWALEALSENYSAELSRFGVDVAIVEPGGYLTGFHKGVLQPSDAERLVDLDALSKEADGFINGFVDFLENSPHQDPQNVADAVVTVIETPAGERPFRTVVDKLGMGDPIVTYNAAFEEMSASIYSQFELGAFRPLRAKSSPESD